MCVSVFVCVCDGDIVCVWCVCMYVCVVCVSWNVYVVYMCGVYMCVICVHRYVVCICMFVYGVCVVCVCVCVCVHVACVCVLYLNVEAKVDVKHFPWLGSALPESRHLTESAGPLSSRELAASIPAQHQCWVTDVHPCTWL